MVKMNTAHSQEKNASTLLPSIESTCMDCIFWYQCRRGEIDCHLRPLRSTENTVRA
ncbi:hypothetical protein [Methanocella sp. MCL-LM]|uniref:hypothetical protein n=1 Tax=Methanocella sp. MCL-LM TaxID=3412035 RepID=UPI003C73B5F7